MASTAISSKPHRIVLLIDLQSPNPNPNYLTSILTTSKLLLSSPPLSSSLSSFKLFFSSLSPLLSASTLHRSLPNPPSPSLSFHSPSQTLASLSTALTSISSPQLPSQFTPPLSNCSHTVAALLHLVNHNDWDSDLDSASASSGIPHCDVTDLTNVMNVRSNLVILLSPVCKSLNSLAEYMCVDVNMSANCSVKLDDCRARFRDCFRDVSDAFNARDIHFCWIDVCDSQGREGERDTSEVSEVEEEWDVVGSEVRKFGWGFCSADSIVLGSALVGFGLVYPYIVASSKLLEACRLGNAVDTLRGRLSLEISDVSGKPLECKFCDLELLYVKGLSKHQDLNLVNKFSGGLSGGSVKLRVTAVQKCAEYGCYEDCSSECFVVRSVESGKKGKDGLDSVFAHRVLELLAGEGSEFSDRKTIPTWQILLSFLYREGYWALVSLTNSNGDSSTGILKPFTVHSAVLFVLDDDGSFVQKGEFSSGKHFHVGDGKRKKMKKDAYQELTWSSFYKAAYEFLEVDLAEVYFAKGLKKSKKLKFLKCWMKEAKKQVLSLNKTPHGCSKTGPDSNEQKETTVNESLTASNGENDELCSDRARTQDGATAAASVSCSETAESFFGSLPRKIQHGLESNGVDLKILAERLVNSSIHWLRRKHESMENVNDSCTLQVTEIINLLLREPKELKEHKDDNAGSTSAYLVREYELQILLRLEILQSEYTGSIKGPVKMKLVKQICSLLDVIQYLVEGGFHGDVSLYDYVERTIKTRYYENLGDVVDKIYDQMDLLPFGEENEDQAFMFNSEDSNQSWIDKHERTDMSASKAIQDTLSIEDESFEKVNKSQECETMDDHARKLEEARERRERARRFVSFTSRMPDLQRVWAPKQSKPVKVKPEPQRKKHKRISYSVVCETPMTGNQPSCGSQRNKGERSNPVSKALFQDDK